MSVTGHTTLVICLPLLSGCATCRQAPLACAASAAAIGAVIVLASERGDRAVGWNAGRSLGPSLRPP